MDKISVSKGRLVFQSRDGSKIICKVNLKHGRMENRKNLSSRHGHGILKK